MGNIGDIRQYKSNLRQKYRTLRDKIDPTQKLKLDNDILKRIVMLNQYASADTVLTYVSKGSEIDTKELIKKALSDGKRVAVPCCVPNTREMNFYYISSLEELSVKSFGVLEPEMDDQRIFKGSEKSICFIPAFCFDNNGYRLGYGMGYYDRFLINYEGVTVGLCYSDFIRGHFQHGKFDCPVEIIVTEKFIRHTILNRR